MTLASPLRKVASKLMAKFRGEAIIRAERNRRLADCDWTQLSDAPIDAAAWAAYRQALRDITGQAGFPWAVAWPSEFAA